MRSQNAATTQDQGRACSAAVERDRGAVGRSLCVPQGFVGRHLSNTAAPPDSSVRPMPARRPSRRGVPGRRGRRSMSAAWPGRRCDPVPRLQPDIAMCWIVKLLLFLRAPAHGALPWAARSALSMFHALTRPATPCASAASSGGVNSTQCFVVLRTARGSEGVRGVCRVGTGDEDANGSFEYVVRVAHCQRSLRG